jgi:hypothetical protein
VLRRAFTSACQTSARWALRLAEHVDQTDARNADSRIGLGVLDQGTFGKRSQAVIFGKVTPSHGT